MALEPSTPVAVGAVIAIVSVGTAGLLGSSVMATDTVLMMVLPSMLAFAAVVFTISVKHGEYRATNE